MTMTEAQERAWYLTRLSPLQQNLLMSLRGLGAWSLYKEGVHPSLVMSMFPLDAEPELRHAETVDAVLTAAASSPQFATVQLIEKRIRRAVKDATDNPGQVRFEFEYQRVHPNDPLLIHALRGLRISNARKSPVARLATMLIDVGNPKGEVVGEAYTATLAGVWFELCDVAVMVDAAPVT